MGSNCTLKTDQILLLFGYIFLFIIGILGNGLVLVVFHKYWRKGPIMELLLLYLATCDLLSSIITPTVFGYWIVTCDGWNFGLALCKIIPPLSRIFNNCSVGFILIMALDRFRSIVTPFKERFDRRYIHMAAAVTVISSIAWEWYYIRSLTIEIYDGNKTCDIADGDDPLYAYPAIVLILLRDVSFVTIFLLSTVPVFLTIRKSEYNIFKGKQKKKISQQSKKIGIMLLMIGVVFALSVIPRDLFLLSFQLTAYVGTPITHTPVMNTLNSSLKLLQTSNSIYNVFIYAGMHEHFWRDVKSLVRCRNRVPEMDLYANTVNCTSYRTEHKKYSVYSSSQKCQSLHQIGSAADCKFSTQSSIDKNVLSVSYHFQPQRFSKYSTKSLDAKICSISPSASQLNNNITRNSVTSNGQYV